MKLGIQIYQIVIYSLNYKKQFFLISIIWNCIVTKNQMLWKMKVVVQSRKGLNSEKSRKCWNFEHFSRYLGKTIPKVSINMKQTLTTISENRAPFFGFWLNSWQSQSKVIWFLWLSSYGAQNMVFSQTVGVNKMKV